MAQGEDWSVFHAPAASEDWSVFHEKPKPEVSRGKAALKGLIEGLTFNLSDEIAAMAPRGSMLSSPKSFEERNEETKALKEAYPLTTFGTNVIGGLATGGLGTAKVLGSAALKAAPMVTKVLAGAGLGAATGATAGAGASDPGSRLEGGTIGGGLGGAIGAAAPAVASAIGRNIVDPLRAMLPRGPQQLAGEYLERYAARDLTKLKDIPRAVAAKGEKAMPVDVGENLATLGEYVAQRPGEAKNIAEQALGERGVGQADRIISKFKELSGLTDDSAVKLGQSAKADMPAILKQKVSVSADDKKLLDLMQRPSLRDAWNVAARTARDEGRPLPDLDNLIEGVRSGKVTKISTEMLHDLKKGLDDVLEPKRDPITGMISAKTGKNELAAQQKLRSEFRNIIKEKNPQYAEAMKDMEGEYRFTGSYEDGKKALTAKYGDITKMLKGKTPEQVNNFRRGYSEALEDAISKPSASGFDITRRVLDPKRIKAVFGDDAGEEIVRTIQAEREMGKVAGKITGGSQTFLRQQTAKDLEENVPDIVASPPTSISEAVMRGLKFLGGTGKRPPQAAMKEVANFLYESDPQALAKMVSEMRRSSPLAFGSNRYTGLTRGTASAEAGRQSGMQKQSY